MNIQNGSFYLYGAGRFGQALSRYFLSTGVSPKAIIDAAPELNSYMGIPIKSLDSNDLDYELPILISILGYGDIKGSLKRRGFVEAVDTNDVFDLFPQALMELTECGFLWMQEPRTKQVDDSKVSQLESLLSDDISKKTLSQIINFRKKPCRSYYPEPEAYEMYFPSDINKLYSYQKLKILDIGAFDGDTLYEYSKRWPEKIYKYLAIEVSPKNISDLNNRGINLPHTGVEVYQGAVGLPDEFDLVLRGNRSATCVEVISKGTALAGDITVPKLDLAKLLHEEDFNIIKMDIEGADYAALVEMADFIKNKLPTLSLSVYHTPEDVWRIPLFINEIAPNSYDFYLRQEGHWGLETIFYAVPK